MLQSMRHLAQSWFFKGLMMLLMVSFGIWGIGDMFRGNPMQNTVAKAGADTITVQQLTHEFERSLAQVRQKLGPDFTAQQAKQMGLLEMTLNNLIARAQVRQQTAAFGIDVSPATMLEIFASVPQFQDKDGKFDKSIMRDRLAERGFNERDYVNQESDELARHTLIDVFVGYNPVPASVVDTLFKARGQKRILDVVTLSNSSVHNIATPDEKILRDYYEHNPKKFTAPEYRTMTIARLATDDVAKEIAISDDQLAKEYEARREQMNRPERRSLIQVVVLDEAKAKKLAETAKASGNLSATAKAEGLEAITLGEADKNSMLPELAAAVFNFKIDEISAPIKTDLGWHIVQLKKIIPAGTPTFDAVKDQLRDSLRHDQAIDAVTKMVNQLDDQLAGGHALEDIADSLKLRVIKIPAVDANGKTADNKDPAELPNKAEVLKAAFAQNSGETSPVMDDKEGNYFVVRTDDVTPSGVKPFDSIKNDVIAGWKESEQAVHAKAEAEKMAGELRAGKAASTFAANEGVEVRVSKPITDLGDTDPALPETLVAQTMKMKKGDVLTWSAADHQIIVRLLNIVDADEKTGAEDKNKITREMNDQSPKELSSEYNKYLRRIIPVKIKQDVLDTLMQQGS